MKGKIDFYSSLLFSLLFCLLFVDCGLWIAGRIHQIPGSHKQILLTGFWRGLFRSSCGGIVMTTGPDSFNERCNHTGAKIAVSLCRELTLYFLNQIIYIKGFGNKIVRSAILAKRLRKIVRCGN